MSTERLGENRCPRCGKPSLAGMLCSECILDTFAPTREDTGLQRAWALKVKYKQQPLPYMFENRQHALVALEFHSYASRDELELVEIWWRVETQPTKNNEH